MMVRMLYLAQPFMVFRWSGRLSISQKSLTASKCALSRAAFFLFRLAFLEAGLSSLPDCELEEAECAERDRELLLESLSDLVAARLSFFLRLLLCALLSLLSLSVVAWRVLLEVFLRLLRSRLERRRSRSLSLSLCLCLSSSLR
jgi:Mn2+/Fe2+ NRAMP family transporter